LFDNDLFVVESFYDCTVRTQIRVAKTSRLVLFHAVNRYIGGRKIFRPYNIVFNGPFLLDNDLFAAQSFYDCTAITRIRVAKRPYQFFCDAASPYFSGRKIFRPYVFVFNGLFVG